MLYRFPEEFWNDKDKCIFLDKVTYKKDSFTKWLVEKGPFYNMSMYERLSIGPNVNPPDLMGDFLIKYLTSKGPEWDYEKEARIVRSSPGSFALPKDFLFQVCFGIRTPQEDIDLIIKIVIQHSDCRRFCKISRDPNHDFGLISEELF